MQSGEVKPDSLRVPLSNTAYSPNRREGEWWPESSGEGLIWKVSVYPLCEEDHPKFPGPPQMIRIE